MRLDLGDDLMAKNAYVHIEAMDDDELSVIVEDAERKIMLELASDTKITWTVVDQWEKGVTMKTPADHIVDANKMMIDHIPDSKKKVETEA